MANLAPPSDDALSRIESYQFPRAHYGHLTQSQNEALIEFRTLCAKQGYYTPASETHKASHEDETLLRYLRARKFVPNDAYVQFKDTEDWRKENKISELYEKIEVEEYDEARRLYPQWTGRRDKRGIPVYVFEVAGLTSKTMAKYQQSNANSQTQGKVPARLLRLFALYENLIQFVMPLCSAVPGRPHEETPISQSNNIVDISRVGLKQFWNLKGHMQDASQLATAHYPETLDRIFIIGAPSFFPTVWSWIKKWFDPITVSKIFILSQRDMQATLEQYIDKDSIPQKYGGNLDWAWGDLPRLDKDIQDALLWKNANKSSRGENCFPAGPIIWQELDNNTLSAIAVGSVNGQQRRQEIATLKNQVSNARHVQSTAADSFGPVSSGLHTHPKETDEYFPKTGDTPTDEQDEPNMQGVTSGQKSQANDSIRDGTSQTKYLQQDQTLAAGEMKDGTPATVDEGHGDKTTIVEPSTVGQAPKDVSVPDNTPSEQQQAPTYMESAMAVAGSAAGTVASAGSAIMSAVGLGGKKQDEPTESEPEPEPQPEDSRVDKIKTNDIEDFIRSQNESNPIDVPR